MFARFLGGAGGGGTQTIEYLKNTTFTTEYSEDFGVFAYFAPLEAAAMQSWMANRKPVTVVYDGEEFSLTPQVIAGMDGEEGVCVGNMVAFGGTGNSEPFAAVSWFVGDTPGFLIGSAVDTSPTQHTIRVYQETSGGASSWNDLTDKPFWEVTETIEPITWDGNTEGLVEVDIFGDKFYKVSDKAFSNEQIKTMSASIYSEWVDPEGSGSGVFPVDIGEEWESMVQNGMVTEDFVFLAAFGVFVIHKNDVVIPDVVAFPGIGTYFQRREQNDEGSYYLDYMTSFPSEATTATTIKKIDEKYLPDPDVFTVILTSNGEESILGAPIVIPNKTFEEAVEAINDGRYIEFKLIQRKPTSTIVSFSTPATYCEYRPTSNDVPFIEIGELFSDITYYWTADGISTIEPSGGK